MKPLPVPQREFAFVAQTFCLVRDAGVDGERVARERDQLEAARRASEATQVKLPLKRTAKKQPVKAKRHARRT